MKPFKSCEISRSEWDAGRRWAVCTTPKASKTIHEDDDYLFFWTRAEARGWIAAHRSLRDTIRGWVGDGCPPATLYREGVDYYTSAHPGGLGGVAVTALADDVWGETPTTQSDADYIARQVIGG